MTTESLTTDVNYTDGKRYLWLLSIMPPLYPLMGWGLVEATGWSLFWWFSVMFVYLVIPLLDWIVGTDENNHPESAVAALEARPYYRWLVYLYIPLHYAVLFWGCWMLINGGLGWFGMIGLTLSIGLVGTGGINAAHELGHKKPALDRWLSRIALAPVANGHFYVEHNKGHHRRVATPEDPASSRFGESFYKFYPRTVIGSIASAWDIEKQRLARMGHGAWHWRNENLQNWAMTVVLWSVIIVWLGWAILPFLIVQAIYGISLLDVVNYLEHYGLCRQKLDDGRYERCQPHHSWNSNHIVSNLFLYQLQRHSDHHANPTRSYQALREFEDAPQLPSGYAAMIVLAYFPPLWRKVMDHRVVQHLNGDMSKANLDPARKDTLMAEYSAA